MKKKNPDQVRFHAYDYERFRELAPFWCLNNGLEPNGKNIDKAIQEMAGEAHQLALKPNPQGPRLAKAYKDLFAFVRGSADERIIKESQYLTTEDAEKKRREFEAAWQHLSWIYMQSVAGITHKMMVYPQGGKEEDMLRVELRRYMYQYATTIMAKCIQLAFDVSRDQMMNYVQKALDIDSDEKVTFDILKGTSGHKMFIRTLIKEIDAILEPLRKKSIGARLLETPLARLKANPLKTRRLIEAYSHLETAHEHARKAHDAVADDRELGFYVGSTVAALRSQLEGLRDAMKKHPDYQRHRTSANAKKKKGRSRSRKR